MPNENTASCCGYRAIQVKQARQDLRGYVRKKSGFRTLTAAEQTQLAELKDVLARQRATYEEHIHDETLEHK